MKIKFFSALTLLWSSISLAALPPFYQSSREIQSILTSETVVSSLGSHVSINSIGKTEKGYLISAGNCSLQVNIVYDPLPDGMAGPLQYHLEFPASVTCK